MAGEHLKNITPEQRAEMVEKAKQARHEKRQWAQENLTLEYADESHWRELASKYGYRMPNKHEKASSKFVNRFLKKFGLDKNFYIDHTGFVNGQKEAKANPKMNAVQQIGLLLECYDEDFREGRLQK